MLILAIGGVGMPAHALPADHYKDHSVLAEGNWAKVSVSEAGMHLISNADLRSLGFQDPAKVRVFGYGGRPLPEDISASAVYDLPEQPVVVTDKGIIFFATDCNVWSATNDGTGKRPYAHELNTYSSRSFYFLTDRSDLPAADFSRIHSPGTSANVKRSFTEHLVHEKELASPGLTGRRFYGEDFRSSRTQTFSFDLPDNTGADVYARVEFGAKATGDSKLTFTANRKPLEQEANDRITKVYISGQAGEMFIQMSSNLTKTIQDAGNRLDLGITYTPEGVLYNARLDYIEVFYDRLLKMKGGELLFHDNVSPGASYEISGCSSSTRIYDVTDIANPAMVDFKLDGDKATFTVTEAGYHEFVAFDPSAITRSATVSGKIANQDLHGLETPDMVIITLPEYADGARRIAALHEQADGFKVHVIEASKIYNEFGSGGADVTAFRKMLKRWYDRPGERTLKHCLLMGKPSHDHRLITAEAQAAGFVPLPIWQSPGGFSETASYSMDDYIGFLEDSEATSTAYAGSYLSLSIGRFPCTSAAEANTAADKLESYILNPSYGPWRNRWMVIADDGDSNDHLKQAQDVVNGWESTPLGAGTVVDRLYLDSYPLEVTSLGNTYPAATARLLQALSEGTAFIDYIGHGSPSGWGHEHLLTWTDIVNLRNTNYSIIGGYTCRFAHWDENDVSGAEHMVLNPVGGAIAIYAATRTVYVSQNGRLNKAGAPYFTMRDESGMPLTLGDAARLGKNRNKANETTKKDDNCLRFAVLGDPAIRMPGGSGTVCFEKIDDTELSSDLSDLPILEALSAHTVSGTVRLPDGNIDEAFDGTLNIQLYDAEKVITTFGNNNGYVTDYNDRTTRLAMVTAKVEKGRWTANLRVPADIEDNYSPARLVGYAWNGSGKEANGETQQLYVYGYDEEGDDDTEGPTIEYFYLNTPNFEDGDIVAANPMLYARMSDKSGINLSDAGMGHKISLNVDNTLFFTDLDTYYSPDNEDSHAGTLLYPLSDIEPGAHTLTLTVWDNANNPTQATLNFSIGAAVTPEIIDLGTDVNPATTSVKFIIDTDRPNAAMNCVIEVFDLNGRTVWTSDSRLATSQGGTLQTEWNLCDSSGHRVPRGIYLYRANITTEEGTHTSKTRKLAVTAP